MSHGQRGRKAQAQRSGDERPRGSQCVRNPLLADVVPHVERGRGCLDSAPATLPGRPATPLAAFAGQRPARA